MKARIAEVFESIQGEGIYLGEKQLFVRFFGCNLSCKFCDTKLDRFTEYEPQELFNELRLYQDDYQAVSFTGGEPLLQKDFLKEVLKLTVSHGYKNYLETNGTLSGELKDVIGYLDIVAMDIKLPTSTGMPNFWGLHRKFLKIASQKEVFIKMVISTHTEKEDLLEAAKLINEINKGAILVLQQDSFGHNQAMENKLRTFKNTCLKEGITTCVIPQMHKAMGLR